MDTQLPSHTAHGNVLVFCSSICLKSKKKAVHSDAVMVECAALVARVVLGAATGLGRRMAGFYYWAQPIPVVLEFGGI